MREGGRDESRNRCVHAGHLANALQSQLSMETCTCRLYLSWDPTDPETMNSRPTTIRTNHPSRPSRESLGSQAAQVRLVHGSLHTRPCKDLGTFFFLGLTSSDCINQAWQTRAWNISPRRPDIRPGGFQHRYLTTYRKTHVILPSRTKEGNRSVLGALCLRK